MKKYHSSLFLLIIILFTLVSCNKDDNSSSLVATVNYEIYKDMQQIYLWYDHLPVNIDPAMYSDPQSFMEALRYTEYDKWSFVISEEEYLQYFVSGEMIGHGFLLGIDGSNNVRVCFLYRFTQAAEAGVKRGWILSKINGTKVTPSNVSTLLGDAEAGVTNIITFTDENNLEVDKTLTKEVISITPVLHYEVLSQGTTKIGYIVFQDFIDAAYAELAEAFAYFAGENIDELIVDLRYNGGGSINVADTLAGWLIGDNYGNQPFVNFKYNDKYASLMNETINLPTINSGLNLSRVFFIGTRNTASASELVINGLTPYTEAILAGDTTDGKPVGMNGFQVKNYIAFPITFKYTNANDVGDFYDGLLPDLPANDDITRDFGDPEEASLKVILDHIGGISVKTTKSTGYKTKLIELNKPINQFIKAY